MRADETVSVVANAAVFDVLSIVHIHRVQSRAAAAAAWRLAPRARSRVRGRTTPRRGSRPCVRRKRLLTDRTFCFAMAVSASDFLRLLLARASVWARGR